LGGGRFKSLEEQTKDPCRAAGAYWEYFGTKDELVDLVPELVEEIEKQEKELVEFRRLSQFQSNGLDLPYDYYENDAYFVE
jgi:hypothetical protein